MPYIEIPYIGSEFLFNYNPVIVPKYHSQPFMSVAWQQSLKYYEKYNQFADIYAPQYFVLKELSQRVCIHIAVPNDDFDGAFLYFERCNGTRVAAPNPSVLIVPGDVNKEGVQMRRLQWEFFINDVGGITAGHYCWYLRVDYVSGVFEELSGLPMDIRAKHENTVLIEYRHSRNDYDVFFKGMNTLFTHRINGNVQYNSDKLERINFRNQKANLRQLYARNWRVYDLEIGFPGQGVNTWDQTKIYNIFKCDEVYIDGVRYLMDDEAEFETTDYGNRFPLKNMKAQIVEYDQSDSLTVGSAGVIPIMPLGNFPYVIDQLTLFGPGSPGFPFPDFLASYAIPGGPVEIINSTEENVFITQLAAELPGFHMTGTFFVDGSTLFYQRGVNETYVPYLFSKLTTCLIVDYSTTPGSVIVSLDIAQTGKTATTVRKAIGEIPFLALEMNSGDFVMNVDTGTVTYTAYRLRIYCDDRQTILNIIGTNINIKGVSGTVSPILNRFDIENGDVGIIGIGFLLRAKLTLQYLFMEKLGITEVDNSDFSPSGDPGRWQNLKFIFLKGNKLTAAKQDKFYVDYYVIASVYHSTPPPPGTLDTRTQSPASAPTGTSSAFRSLYAVYGFLITY